MWRNFLAGILAVGLVGGTPLLRGEAPNRIDELNAKLDAFSKAAVSSGARTVYVRDSDIRQKLAAHFAQDHLTKEEERQLFDRHLDNLTFPTVLANRPVETHFANNATHDWVSDASLYPEPEYKSGNDPRSLPEGSLVKILEKATDTLYKIRVEVYGGGPAPANLLKRDEVAYVGYLSLGSGDLEAYRKNSRAHDLYHQVQIKTVVPYSFSAGGPTITATPNPEAESKGHRRVLAGLPAELSRWSKAPVVLLVPTFELHQKTAYRGRLSEPEETLRIAVAEHRLTEGELKKENWFGSPPLSEAEIAWLQSDRGVFYPLRVKHLFDLLDRKQASLWQNRKTVPYPTDPEGRGKAISDAVAGESVTPQELSGLHARWLESDSSAPLYNARTYFQTVNSDVVRWIDYCTPVYLNRHGLEPRVYVSPFSIFEVLQTDGSYSKIRVQVTGPTSLCISAPPEEANAKSGTTGWISNSVLAEQTVTRSFFERQYVGRLEEIKKKSRLPWKP